MDERDWPAERQLASRARRDFDGLVEVLDPDVVLSAAGSREVRRGGRGRRPRCAYSQLGLVVKPALMNGGVGLVATRDCQPFSEQRHKSVRPRVLMTRCNPSARARSALRTSSGERSHSHDA
jgi:hypothetical protein